MPQSSVIAFALVIAFVVFTIVKGQLPCWLEILGFATGSHCQTLTGITGASYALDTTGGGLTIQAPSINAGPVTVNPPPIVLG